MNFTKAIKKIRRAYVIRHAQKAKIPRFDPSEGRRIRILFSGKVQKVGFRQEVHEMAQRLNLTGWVKNRSDLSVEAEVQGEALRIDFLIAHMKSLKRAAVREVTMADLPVVRGEEGFIILRPR